MPAPDARTRNKISLSPARVSPSSVRQLLPTVLLSNVLYVSALHAGKEWLLARDVGVFWTVLRVLTLGGLVVLVREAYAGQLQQKRKIEWSVLGLSSLLLFVQISCLFIALLRLSPTRVVLLTQFSTLWLKSLLEPKSARRILAVGLAWLSSFLSSLFLSQDTMTAILPHFALALCAVTSLGLEHTRGVLSSSLGQNFATAATTLGASLIGIPLYTFKKVCLNWPSSPIIPFYSLAALPLLSFSLLYHFPKMERAVTNMSSGPQYFILSYPSAFLLSTVVGSLAFSQPFTWTDALIGCLLYYGLYPSDKQGLVGPPRTPTSKLVRSYMKTILSNPESRKIFYFLVLNMSYMLVQMLYGVWTNSLGLISDAIHMAFDCMAIGVGLFASIMATWPPNEQFTYGYERIETLSGFANGIFLILISIFIVFEAIQRILEPPEMNTSQLLLVSSLGLAVNLFGMFAMGGHHHGGHSHSHGHSHATPTVDHVEHSSVHRDDHSQSHSHPHSFSPPNRVDVVSESHLHSHDLSNSHPYPQSPSRMHAHDSDASHNHTHPLADSLGESRSHSRVPSLQLHHNSRNDSRSHSHGDAVSSTPFAQDSSPITPSYHFGHDDHYETHTHSAHTPNLHDHSHVHAHSHEGHSHNMRGVFLHVMADTLGSVGVIISTLLIQFYGWTGFDPIASLFIAILIAASVIPLVIDTGRLLCLDVSERESDIRGALSELESVEGLAAFTSARFWPKDASSLIGSIRIQLHTSSSSGLDQAPLHSSKRKAYSSMDNVVERVDTLLRARITGLQELTIQVEGKPLAPGF